MNDLYLEHHGILGMKWGIRRYQNKDGSYTEEGKQRYQEAKPPKEKKQISKETIAVGATVGAMALGTIGSLVLYNKDPDKWWEMHDKVGELAEKGRAATAPLMSVLSVGLTLSQIFNSGKQKKESEYD